MYVCDECRKETDQIKDFLRSHGPCELCGKTAVCTNIWAGQPFECPMRWLTCADKRACQNLQGCSKRAVANNGFSLIDVLVAIAVVAVLLSILLPGVSRARESARGLRCMVQARDAGIAWVEIADRTNRIPMAPSEFHRLLGQIPCPTSRLVLDDIGNTGLPFQARRVLEDPRWPIVWDRWDVRCQPHQGKGVVVRSDVSGHMTTEGEEHQRVMGMLAGY